MNLQDCVKLLVLAPGTLLLALESLGEQATLQATQATLQDLGVARLTGEQALQVIHTRVDLDLQ